jgi:hypothetical protein
LRPALAGNLGQWLGAATRDDDGIAFGRQRERDRAPDA